MFCLKYFSRYLLFEKWCAGYLLPCRCSSYLRTHTWHGVWGGPKAILRRISWSFVSPVFSCNILSGRCCSCYPPAHTNTTGVTQVKLTSKMGVASVFTSLSLTLGVVIGVNSLPWDTREARHPGYHILLFPGNLRCTIRRLTREQGWTAEWAVRRQPS